MCAQDVGDIRQCIRMRPLQCVPYKHTSSYTMANLMYFNQAICIISFTTPSPVYVATRSLRPSDQTTNSLLIFSNPFAQILRRNPRFPHIPGIQGALQHSWHPVASPGWRNRFPAGTITLSSPRNTTSRLLAFDVVRVDAGHP